MAKVPQKIIERYGWGNLPGHNLNHFFIGTWTACEKLGPVHEEAHLPVRYLPDCVTCKRLMEKKNGVCKK